MQRFIERGNKKTETGVSLLSVCPLQSASVPPLSLTPLQKNIFFLKYAGKKWPNEQQDNKCRLVGVNYPTFGNLHKQTQLRNAYLCAP